MLKNKEGISLVEVLIALAILGIIAVTFIMAIFVATKSIAIADERTNAESLARDQMEYVKRQAYVYDNNEAEYVTLALAGTQYLEGTPYSVWSVNRAGETVAQVIAIPWDSEDNLPASTDEGLQKITLKIFHGDDKEILTLEGYKVDESVY